LFKAEKVFKNVSISIFSCLLESNLLIVTELESTSFLPQINKRGIYKELCEKQLINKL